MEPGSISIALLGATGAIGRAVLEVLEDLDVPVGRIRLLATARSAGQELDFRGGPVKVEVPSDEAFTGCDVAILAGGAESSREWAPRARPPAAWWWTTPPPSGRTPVCRWWCRR
jgi:aspartate-semialdehyde dehydrogenase